MAINSVQHRYLCNNAHCLFSSSNSASSSSHQYGTTYGELELFLCGLDLSHLVPLFQSQHVEFKTFLRLTEEDLIKVVWRYTIKFLNFRTPENFAVIYLKFKQRQNLLIFRLIDANGIANSEDPDQTAPLGAV